MPPKYVITGAWNSYKEYKILRDAEVDKEIKETKARRKEENK